MFKLVFGKDLSNRRPKPLSQKSLQQIQEWQESLGIAGEGLLGSENFWRRSGCECESSNQVSQCCRSFQVMGHWFRSSMHCSAQTSLANFCDVDTWAPAGEQCPYTAQLDAIDEVRSLTPRELAVLNIMWKYITVSWQKKPCGMPQIQTYQNIS